MRIVAPAVRRILPAGILLTTSAWTLGCGGGGAGSVTPPSPSPPLITVVVSPQNGTVLLGETLSFTAQVSNSADTAVSWSVNGIPGGSAQTGVITSDGVYTAPADLPSGGMVHVTATSHADPTKSATAGVVISSDITVSLSPASASIELGAKQTFQASITSSGHPDPSIHWSLSAAGCPISCGSIDASGNYTAPPILPSPAAISITSTSAADPSKQSTANVTIKSDFLLQLSAPATLQPNVTAALVATLTPVPGSHPNGQLSWSLSGSGCSGNSCGTLTVTTAQSTGGNSNNNTASYTAPANPAQPIAVTITVTPQADPSKKAQAVIDIAAIAQGENLGLSPATVTLAGNHRVTLTATQNGGATGSVAWSVNGISGGNSTVGQVCVVGSNPCQGIASGTALQADYLAPGAVPSPNPVSVAVASASDATLTASSQITIINHVLISVLPSNVTLPPLGVQGFTASVLGTTNQSVVWQIQGTACTTSGVCGGITPDATYTAPSQPPAPDTLTIVAVSQDDTSQSGSASVTISAGPHILTLHPASVYAGAEDGFTLRVDGSGFVPSNPGPGSVLQIGSASRVTTCDSANSCHAPVFSTDVNAPGSTSVQIQNPDKTASNAVNLMIVVLGTTDAVVTLASDSPKAAGKDIIVVEPTTAGLDTAQSNLDMDVAAIGAYVTSTNTCNLAGNRIPLTRPSSGTSAADICLFSQSGFNTTMNYWVSGPGDIAVIAKQPAGLGIIHLTLQVPSSALPGARTLFIQNANLDRTAATGVLEVW